jgi:enamine deaminase RidA (YjgF/YER057c/UK114 family)
MAMRRSVSGLLLLALVSLSTGAWAQGQASRYLNPPSLVKPTGYSHLVVAPDGRTVYVAGQVALDSTGQLAARDFRGQADRVFQNLRRAMESVGGSLDDLVKTTTYITDRSQIPVLREVREKYLNRRSPPASTLLVVSGLARDDLLIEIEAVAVLPAAVRLIR